MLVEYDRQRLRHSLVMAAAKRVDVNQPDDGGLSPRYVFGALHRVLSK